MNWQTLKAIWRKPSTGLGDTIAKLTKTFGIEPCDACERRRKAFNEKIAYRKRKR
jgi:hypothetical protein